MKKIIEYLKTFGEDFSKHIEDFRSKAVLLSSMKDWNEKYSNENFVMELDNIDITFLFMSLDVLETYNQYKLCIFVCNRYSLNHRVGRYLLFIAHRYSFIANDQPLVSHIRYCLETINSLKINKKKDSSSALL
jgi:hypothetical protein